MSPFARLSAAVIASIAWAALILQYALLIELTWNEIGPALGTLRFFSFFTILSNLLVALTAMFAIAPARKALGRFFTQPRVRGAAALCIGITCGIYFFLLASTWSPQGAQLLADVLMHYVVPALYIAWWIICVEHGRLGWSDALRWLLFPLGFLAWTLARGAWLHEYPYPFIDVDALGIAVAMCNAFGIGILFFAFGLVVVAVDRCAGSKESR